MSASKRQPPPRKRQAPGLLDTFRSLDKEMKNTLADLDSPLLLAFAALSIAAEKSDTERLSAEHIVACLEAAAVAVSKTSVEKSLARAGTRVSTRAGPDGDTLYRLMTAGERQVTPYLGGKGIAVVRFDSGQPRTARTRLGEILSKLSGRVKICDPYYGVRTLDSLDYVPKGCAVQFLTARSNEAGPKLTAALRDFRQERSKVEFRITDRPSELHDRYVLSDDQLLLVGHGLKDIGTKESFMICLEQDLAPDLLEEIRKSFEARWARGKMI